MAEPHFFFAAWPPEDVLSSLRQRLATLGQQDWPPDSRCELPMRWHLTLCYLGTADPKPLQSRLDACWPGPFPITVTFDRIGAFHGGRVLWIGAPEAPTALQQWWQGWLAGNAAKAGPFVPHVTVLRAPRPRPWVERVMAPLPWTLRELTLVASSGGHYTVLQRWQMSSG